MIDIITFGSFSHFHEIILDTSLLRLKPYSQPCQPSRETTAEISLLEDYAPFDLPSSCSHQKLEFPQQ